jgi:hypothetical protein
MLASERPARLGRSSNETSTLLKTIRLGREYPTVTVVTVRQNRGVREWLDSRDFALIEGSI